MYLKRYSRLVFLLLHFWWRFLTQQCLKKTPPQLRNKTTFWGLIFHMRFCWPQGSILVSFWPHFEAPRLHFEVILAHILAPKGPNLEPWASDICSFRFCPFHKNLLCLILSFLSVLQKHSTHRFDPHAQNFWKHFITTPLTKTSISHRGRRYREAFYDNSYYLQYIYICIY